ncbi:MAG: preprotein translocase subunit SecY, partial [Alistipes sp.]|nr:preprotein translocase subunit SecY [Alistipes sp.]
MNKYIVVGIILVVLVALLATNKKLVETLKNIYKIEELRSRILFTLGLLLIYRLGSFVTLPGVDHAVLEQWTQNFANDSSSLMGLLNIFSGGAFSQASIFALGVMPYITASIIIQLLGIMVPYFRKMQREGESGRRRMNQWTRFLTIAVLLLQGPAYLATQVLSSGAVTVTGNFLGIANGAFIVPSVIILIAGTMFIMWLGEKITDKGIGNG